MKNRKDNKGFTLVEVIIAVVILGIVFSPLLKNFIESAKLNNRARKTLNATTMAQNIMEGISAYSAEDIIKSLDSAPDGEAVPVVPANMTIVSHGEINPSNGVLTQATATSGSQVTLDPTTSMYESQYCTYSVSANGIVRPEKVKVNALGTNLSGANFAKYQFYLQGVTVRGATTSTDVTYDMVVTIDTDGYDVANTKETSKIASMNGLYDFSWRDDKTSREDCIKNLHLSSGESNATLNNKTKHIINVNLNKDATDTTVKVQHVYDAGSSGSKTIDEANYFSKNKTSQDPRNVYIYYWPNYTSSAYYDEINISSNLPTRTNVYLIRMKVDADVVSDSVTYYGETTEAAEAGYKAVITADGPVDVYTNAAYYVCHGFGDGGHIWTDAVIGTRAIKTATSGAVINLGLSEKETENRIYNVTLDVYNSGAITASGINTAMKVATFTGGTTE